MDDPSIGSPPLLENLNPQGGELGVGASGAQINENLKENLAPQVSPPPC